MTIAVKICGLKTADALDAALDGGADYVGLVFFQKSPRNIDMGTAAQLSARARGRAKTVALTVDAQDDLFHAIIAKVAPDLLQLHGSEAPERVAQVRERFGLPVIKALGISSAADVAAAARYRAADLVLFDAKPIPDADRPGGNGVPFDWRVLEGVTAGSFMLSGGLTPENVVEAIALTRPAAVDVSSGVESAPGIKDTARIRRFLRAVKTAKA